MNDNDKITADQVSLLLQAKHSGDICVPECKTGSTTMSSFRTLDLWVMPRSWAHMNIIGYEIKVSRQDFLHDEKWQKYLPYCHSFYFACPPGVISPDELPAEVGLMVTTTRGKAMLTKRKAVRRDVEIPESIYQYILMSRAKILRECGEGNNENFWRLWLENREINGKLGYRVSKTLREEINNRIEKVERDNHALQLENERLADVKNTLVELGFETYASRWDVRRKAQELSKLVPEELLKAIKKTQRELAGFQDALTKLEQENAQKSA